MYLARYIQEQQGPVLMHGYDRGDSWVGALVGLAFLALMVWLVIYVVRALTNNGTAAASTRDPIDIAKERYAKGEITKDELIEIKKELK